MPRDYTKIIAWQRAHRLVLAVYEATRTFPKEERFGVVNQLRRGAYSISSNIVEGSARSSNRDYLHFLNMAGASLRELEYFLLLARDLDYLPGEEYRSLSELADKTASPSCAANCPEFFSRPPAVADLRLQDAGGDVDVPRPARGV
jgi:four helix bundle protein